MANHVLFVGRENLCGSVLRREIWHQIDLPQKCFELLLISYQEILLVKLLEHLLPRLNEVFVFFITG